MLINYELNEDLTFKWWRVEPINENEPYLEIENPQEIIIGKTKLINGEIVQPIETDADLIQKAYNNFRTYRAFVFRGFDVWEKNVLRGREQDDNEIMAWYQEMLDFTELITKDTTPDDYPKIPDKIKKYLGVD